jgi:hypothetical protein
MSPYPPQACETRFSSVSRLASSVDAKSPMHSLSIVKGFKFVDCGRMTGNSEGNYVAKNKLEWVDQKGPIRAILRVISGVECGLYHLVSMSCVTLPK